MLVVVGGGKRRGGAVSRGGERGISQKKQEILFQAKIRRVFATRDLFGKNVYFSN